MATRNEVIEKLKSVRDEVTAIVESAPESAWASPVYSEGWTCHDLLSHIASTSGPAGFILMMAKSGPPGGGGSAFDQDEFNRQQVAMRAERTPADILDEIRSNIQRDAQATESAPEELLAKHFVAPWGVEGTVAEVIIASLTGHLGMHIADLRAALRS